VDQGRSFTRLVDKARLLLNQPRLDIEFVKGMMQTISDNTILSSLATMLEHFFVQFEGKEKNRKHLADAQNVHIDDDVKARTHRT
jgi:hypothetical protein